MPESESTPEAARPRKGPEMVAPSSRVNVSLPFSRIEIVEQSKELHELAGIVAELVAIVEGVAPGPATKELRRRAEALSLRAR